MSPNKISKFINSIVRFIDRFPEAGKNLPGFITEKLNQDIVFILEIKVDGPIGNPGFFCNLRNG